MATSGDGGVRGDSERQETDASNRVHGRSTMYQLDTSLQYSNEARAYHARYAALSQDRESGFLYRCKEGCLDLLTEPNLPYNTKVQTLQMLSTLINEAGAERALKEAEDILEGLDGSKFQVALLKEDNLSMQRDLYDWRVREGLVGRDLEEVMVERAQERTRNGTRAAEEKENSEECKEAEHPLVAACWQFDRDIQQALDQELEEGLEHIAYRAPGYNDTATAARADSLSRDDVAASGLTEGSGQESVQGRLPSPGNSASG